MSSTRLPTLGIVALVAFGCGATSRTSGSAPPTSTPETQRIHRALRRRLLIRLDDLRDILESSDRPPA